MKGQTLISLTLIAMAIVNWTSVSCQHTYAETYTRLLSDLYAVNLDKRARPVKNRSTITYTTVDFWLLSVLKFDMVAQTLTSSGFLNVTWYNEYTTWNPQHYDGMGYVAVDQDLLWKPALALQNTVKELKAMSTNYAEMLISSDGLVNWYPPSVMETQCTADVYLYPFDTQTCRWKLAVWGGYDHSVVLKTARPAIRLDSYESSGEWDLLKATGTPRPFNQTENANVTENLLEYEVTLKRRPALASLTLILPVLLLGLVNVFVFTIPPQLGGERLSYSLTVLLSFSVFYGNVVDALPSATEVIPLAVIVLSVHLVLSALYVLLCVLSVRGENDLRESTPRDHKAKKEIQTAAHHQDPRQAVTWKRVSRTLDTLFFGCFGSLLLAGNVAIVLAIVWRVNSYIKHESAYLGPVA